MKIVYCLNSIRYLGGIQRVTITKANALASVDGNEVYVIVTDNREGMMVLPLSEKVHLINLDINYYDGDRRRSKISDLFVSLFLRKKHKKYFYKELCAIRPEVVISVGTSEKYMLLSMRKRSWKVIREFHFDRHYRKRLAKTWFDKLVANVSDYYDFTFKERKYDKIVVLTQEDKETNWKGWDNVTVIPNPLSFQSVESSPLNQKVVISLGRLDYQKNYSSLIRAFKLVCERFPDWVLHIYGDGDERQMLQQLIEIKNLSSNVCLKGVTSDVQKALLESSIFVLSSITEGFALVLVEAMECGLPVVSYQCPCGPKDIISDGSDGFLVSINDEQAFADRICELIENQDVRKQMGVAGKLTARKYHVEIIAQQWMTLFENVMKQ